MRIERISENSIRCMLTNFDLSIRNIKLSELTYGSESARSLFHEMMQRASSEVGFEVEDMPIMVEAIPMANDSIMLIITKVEDAEELDTRFSRFTPDHDDEKAWSNMTTELLEGANELLNLLNSPELLEQLGGLPISGGNTPGMTAGTLNTNPADHKSLQPHNNESKNPIQQNMRIYQFDTLDMVCAAARKTGHIFTGDSVLYKNPQNEKFYLILKKADCDDLTFSKTCNLLSEYAVRQKHDAATEAYYGEHYEIFVKQNVLRALAQL